MNVIPVEVKYQVGKISSNLDEVAEAVRAAADEYRGIVITPDAIAEGKKTLAALRKEKASLDADRKKIKKAWLAPFEEWEKKAKEIIALYDEPEAALNEQVKAYEADRIAEKQERIKNIHDSFGSISEYFPLSRIYNPKWENTGYSEADILSDMETERDFAEMKITAVKAMNSKYEEDGLRVLKETGDFQKAVSKMTEMQEQEKRIEEERERRIEEEREKAFAAVRDEEEQRKLIFEEVPEKNEKPMYLVTVPECFENEFENFCFLNGCSFERV